MRERLRENLSRFETACRIGRIGVFECTRGSRILFSANDIFFEQFGIPADMVYIANLFDKGVLGDVDPEEFRRKGWDPANRPVRRAMHFFNENERVPLMRDALKRGDGATYMRLMNESGRSSEELLNNIITSATGDTKLAQGLDRSRKLLEGKGAWRVHGGGFAGCVQALMPTDYFPTYKEDMEKAFGGGSCREIRLV